jgi:hypothetical protein
MDSDCPFGILWPLCCLFFFDIWILIAPLVSFGQHNGQKIPKGQSESIYQRRTDNTMAKRYQRGNQNPYIKEEQTTQAIVLSVLL